MASFNKILLMGNLTRDPQLNYLPSNTPVVEIGIAVNRRFKRQDGQQGEEVLFVDCRAFGRTAEVINQYFQKGKPIFIEGRLQLDQWEDKQGQKRSKHRVFIENFQFVEARGGSGGNGGNQSDSGGYSNASNARDGNGGNSGGSQGYNSGADEMQEEDIPF